MAGFLVPPWFRKQTMTEYDVMVASIFLGFNVAFASFSASTAARQTLQAWARSRRVTVYIGMVWVHWLTNNAFGIVSFLYLRDVIQASFWLWFFILFLWVFQSQLIVQIIVNRISLLIMVKTRACRIKFVVLVIMTLINVSVFIVWIPARLEINEIWINANHIWDRIEKVIFLLLDLALNIYFIYLVRHQLIANGLTKYYPLFRFNICSVLVSISADVILISLMSLPNDLIYLQFQSVAYAVKLQIEMNMADLIKKVVRAQNDGRTPSSTLCPRLWGSRASKSKGLHTTARTREDPFFINISNTRQSNTRHSNTRHSNPRPLNNTRQSNTRRGQTTTQVEFEDTEKPNEGTRNQQDADSGTPSGIPKTAVVTESVHGKSKEEEDQITPLPSQPWDDTETSVSQCPRA